MALYLHRFKALHGVVLVASLLVVALGVTVMIGWAFNITALKSVLPGLVTMKVNTALGMVLCGGALVLLSSEKSAAISVRILISGIALIAIALGVLSLSEDLFGWKLGIDQWLLRDAT